MQELQTVQRAICIQNHDPILTGVKITPDTRRFDFDAVQMLIYQLKLCLLKTKKQIVKSNLLVPLFYVIVSFEGNHSETEETFTLEVLENNK